MSCEESRSRYLTTISGVSAGELKRLFARKRGTPSHALEAAGNEAKTRLLFAQFARCHPPLRPPMAITDSCKVTKTKGALPSGEAARKLLFLVIRDILRKWETPLFN